MLVVFVVPVFVYMLSPELLFVVSDVFVYVTVEFCYLRMVRICRSEIVSIIDLCKDVRGNGFVSFVDVASWYELFVCLYDGVCDEFSLVMNVV